MSVVTLRLAHSCFLLLYAPPTARQEKITRAFADVENRGKVFILLHWCAHQLSTRAPLLYVRSSKQGEKIILWKVKATPVGLAKLLDVVFTAAQMLFSVVLCSVRCCSTSAELRGLRARAEENQTWAPRFLREQQPR